MSAATGRLTLILVKCTLPPSRGGAYATVVATSCSVRWPPDCVVKATSSSETDVVCGLPSSVTGTGVIWLPSTLPVAPSTSCANTHVGRVPGATVPEYVRSSFGPPTTTASAGVGIVTFTAVAALDGVTAQALPAT